MLKNDVIWPEHRHFKSRTKWEPVGFFSECLCNANSFDLMLGFFSSSAIQVLADGFAIFIYNGGRMRMIVNDVLTDEDLDFIVKGNSVSTLTELFDSENIESIKNALSIRDRHFFNCLSWLIKSGRLDIKIVRPKIGIGISHTKMGIFSDGIYAVSFDGSCNFSQTALVYNIESVTASCDWDGRIEKAKVDNAKEVFNVAFDERDESVEYLSPDRLKESIIKAFPPKEIEALIEDERRLLKSHPKANFNNNIAYALHRAKERLEHTISQLAEPLTQYKPSRNVTPKFPYPTGPREYQVKAFNNWKNNKQRGMFAMATGTGKTITSLNCLLQIYKKAGAYKAIILVPTTVLVDQWVEECEKFNFSNIIRVYSKNTQWKKEIDNVLLKETLANENDPSYIIICTYASFARDNVFDSLIKFPKKKLLLIADEAHNMGAGKIRARLSMIPYLRRIGLSATPKRQYDKDGNNAISNFYGITDGYTFEYPMGKAIDDGFLCRYYYYPHIVNLTSDELKEYVELSTLIAKFYNPNNDTFKADDMLTALLLKRKRIIHKAVNKKAVFADIIKERLKEKGSLKFTLVYVPEGNEPSDFVDDDFCDSEGIDDDMETIHLIDDYTRIVAEADEHATVVQFTSESKNRAEILEKFASGEINVLTSMKCLDEGVDVPRSEMAIFCASTGNPRQFIQRRGRILRTHKDKSFAVIHDLIVAPLIDECSPSYCMERSLFNNEMRRVREFADLAENSAYTAEILEGLLNYYNLPVFE